MNLTKNTYLLQTLLKNNNIAFNKSYIKKKIYIKNAGDLYSSRKNYISFFSNLKYLNLLKKTKADVIITKENLKKYIPKNKIILISDYPEIDFAKILSFFYPQSYYSTITYKKLKLEEITKKFPNLKFGINFYLENNVKIGNNVQIGNNVTIKENCKIGNNVIIGSNVVIESSDIFDDVHICDGSIIGKKGFGFKFIGDNCVRIPHIGRVQIHKGCEIGANSVIDRGSVGNTIIGEYTFFDNLVHIAHNVIIGKRCIFAAQVGIAGSTKIGNYVTIGGQAGISGHLKIGDNVKIGGKSGVVKNIRDNEVVMGYPAKPIKEFLKN